MTPTRVIVHDGNPDALERRSTAAAQALPDAQVIATPSSAAMLVIAASSAPGTPAFIDLCASDRLSLDRPGERVIGRLARNPATAHVRPIAWSAYVGADIVAGARAAGAAGFVTATLDRAAEAAALQRAGAGEAIWPEASAAPDTWNDWFEQTYGAAWEAWMEPVLVRLATTAERRSIAAELVHRGAARTSTHAASRMREVARLIAGEHSNAPAVVAQQAAVALARLAVRTPLVERPAVTVSLTRSAEALRNAPSLALAAGLTQLEVDDVLALDALIAGQPDTARRPGAPPADQARAERQWAAGRRALQLAPDVTEVDAVITAVLRRVDAALLAIDDALIDAERYPAARAAAALSAIAQTDQTAPSGLGRIADAVTWRGLRPAELAVTTTIPNDDLRAFTARVDDWLAARAPSAR